MRKVVYLSVALLSLAFYSCGKSSSSSSDSSKVTPETTKVEGDLRECFEVVDKEYTPKESDLGSYDRSLIIELKRTSEELPVDLRGLTYDNRTWIDELQGKEYEILFDVSLLDEDGNIVATTSSGYSAIPDVELQFDVKKIPNLSEAETFSIEILYSSELFENAKLSKFKVGSAIIVDAVSDYSEESDFDEEMESDAVGSSSDWDSVLDEYEDYVNQYIKLYKKAMEGDMSAMSEYAGMLEKAQSLFSKLENAQGEMTAAQISRMNSIQMKMVNAMQ